MISIEIVFCFIFLSFTLQCSNSFILFKLESLIQEFLLVFNGLSISEVHLGTGILFVVFAVLGIHSLAKSIIPNNNPVTINNNI